MTTAPTTTAGAAGAVNPTKFFNAFKGYCNAYDLGDATRALTVLLKCIRTIYQEQQQQQQQQQLQQQPTKDNQDKEEEELPQLKEARQNFQLLYELLLTGTKEQVIRGTKGNTEGKTIQRKKQKKGSLVTPFPIDGSKSSVQEALHAAVQPTIVKGYNWDTGTVGDYEESILETTTSETESATSSSCDQWQTTKQLNFISLPVFFMLHLQRFEYQNGRVEASQQPIEVPNNLHLQPEQLHYNYQLVGGILHADDDDQAERHNQDYEGGHYTTLLRLRGSDDDAKDNKWNVVDGVHVTEISQQEALDLLSGKPGASSIASGPTRGTLLVYSRQFTCTETSAIEDEVKQLLEQFQQSLSQAASQGYSLFPPSVSSDSANNPLKLIGKRLRIRWSGGKFYAGTIVDYDQTTNKHKVEYDDGDIRQYKLHKKVVEWEMNEMK